jgi:hypothetical protein
MQLTVLAFTFTAIGFAAAPSWAATLIAPAPTQAAASSQASTNRLPNGKKLILKDGTFQVVRSYEKTGERVRYYSLERGGWEEIPASLVDWDATTKAEAEKDKADAALANKIHKQEEASRMDPPLDVDASLQIAPNIILPAGEGMFVTDGHSIWAIPEVGTQTRVDKKTVLKQVLSPIPIVASKHNIELPGAKAEVRITTSGPEFYLREFPTDAERDSGITKSSRGGPSGPELELVRATVKGNKRLLESIRSFYGARETTERKSVAVQRWEIATNVYRFTLGEPLPPGEYALAEILSDSMNLFVWDFGVDPAPNAVPAKK